jgi:hypothetical protein
MLLVPNPAPRDACRMKTRTVRLFCLALGGGPAIASCGDGGATGPTSCSQIQPCGGDVVGTWHFVGTCQDTVTMTAQAESECPGGSVDHATVDVSGTVTYRADLSYTLTALTQSSSETKTIPLSCTSYASCAELQTSLGAGPSNGTVSASCTGTTTCVCAVSSSVGPLNDVGTYILSGTNLITSGVDSQELNPYCVRNDRLDLLDLSASLTDPSGKPLLLSDIALQKE